MMKKLPGYEKAEELIALYKKAGFSDEETAKELMTIEKLVLAELVGEIEQKMTPAEKQSFDDFLKNGPKPEEIASFLKLEPTELAQKIDSKLQNLIDRFKQEIAAKQAS